MAPVSIPPLDVASSPTLSSSLRATAAGLPSTVWLSAPTPDSVTTVVKSRIPTGFRLEKVENFVVDSATTAGTPDNHASTMIWVYAATAVGAAFLVVVVCKIARNYLRSRNSTSTDVDKESATVTAPCDKDEMKVMDNVPTGLTTPAQLPPVQAPPPTPPRIDRIDRAIRVESITICNIPSATTLEVNGPQDSEKRSVSASPASSFVNSVTPGPEPDTSCGTSQASIEEVLETKTEDVHPHAEKEGQVMVDTGATDTKTDADRVVSIDEAMEDVATAEGTTATTTVETTDGDDDVEFTFNAFRKPVEGEEDNAEDEDDIEITDNIDKWIGGNADQADDDSVYSGELIGGMPLEDPVAVVKTVQVDQVAVVVQPLQAEMCVKEHVEVEVGTVDDSRPVIVGGAEEATGSDSPITAVGTDAKVECVDKETTQNEEKVDDGVNVIKDEVDLSVKEDIIKTTPLVEITKSAPKRRRGMTVVGPAKVDKENHKNTKTGGVKGRRRALTVLNNLPYTSTALEVPKSKDILSVRMESTVAVPGVPPPVTLTYPLRGRMPRMIQPASRVAGVRIPSPPRVTRKATKGGSTVATIERGCAVPARPINNKTKLVIPANEVKEGPGNATETIKDSQYEVGGKEEGTSKVCGATVHSGHSTTDVMNKESAGITSSSDKQELDSVPSIFENKTNARSRALTIRERMPTSIQPARQVAGMRIRSPPGSPRKKRRQGVPVIETLQNIIEEEEEEEVVVNENQDPVKQVAAPPRKGRERGMTVSHIPVTVTASTKPFDGSDDDTCVIRERILVHGVEATTDNVLGKLKQALSQESDYNEDSRDDLSEDSHYSQPSESGSVISNSSAKFIFLDSATRPGVGDNEDCLDLRLHEPLHHALVPSKSCLGRHGASNGVEKGKNKEVQISDFDDMPAKQILSSRLGQLFESRNMSTGSLDTTMVFKEPTPTSHIPTVSVVAQVFPFTDVPTPRYIPFSEMTGKPSPTRPTRSTVALSNLEQSESMSKSLVQVMKTAISSMKTNKSTTVSNVTGPSMETVVEAPTVIVSAPGVPFPGHLVNAMTAGPAATLPVTQPSSDNPKAKSSGSFSVSSFGTITDGSKEKGVEGSRSRSPVKVMAKLPRRAFNSVLNMASKKTKSGDSRRKGGNANGKENAC